MSVNLTGASDRICLKGLSARGLHGVLPLEREEPQLFVVDLSLELGPGGAQAAAASDQLAESVDYAAVATSVISVIEGDSVNLIETLAARIADLVLGYPRVRAVEVTVHKPEAPLDVAFDDVSVTIRRGELAAGSVGAPASQQLPAPAAQVAAATADPAFPPVPAPAFVPEAERAFLPVQDASVPPPPPVLTQVPVPSEPAALEVEPSPQELPGAPEAQSVPGPEEPLAFDASIGPLDSAIGKAPQAPVDPELAAALAAPAPAPLDMSVFEDAPELLEAPVADLAAPEAEEPVQAVEPSGLDQADGAPSGFEGPAVDAVDAEAGGLAAGALGATGAAAAGTLAAGAVAAESRAESGIEALIADAHAVEASAEAEFGPAGWGRGAEPFSPFAPDPENVPAAPVAEDLLHPQAESAPLGENHPGQPGAGFPEPPVPGGGTAAPAPFSDPLRSRPAQPAAFVLALGGNVGAVLPNLRNAVAALRDTVGVELAQVAPLARTAAVTDPGSEPQPDFLNTVLLGMTVLSPMELLEVARKLEADAGRVRTKVNGPRTLDVDLIDYEGVVSNDPELTLPHPRAVQRAFVLVPWAEADDLAEISGQSVALLAENAADRDGVRWLALDWEDSDSLPALPTGQYIAPPLAADELSEQAPQGQEPEEDALPRHTDEAAAPLPQEHATALEEMPEAEPAAMASPEAEAPSAEDSWGAPVAWKDVLGGNQGRE